MFNGSFLLKCVLLSLKKKKKGIIFKKVRSFIVYGSFCLFIFENSFPFIPKKCLHMLLEKQLLRSTYLMYFNFSILFYFFILDFSKYNVFYLAPSYLKFIFKVNSSIHVCKYFLR